MSRWETRPESKGRLRRSEPTRRLRSRWLKPASHLSEPVRDESRRVRNVVLSLSKKAPSCPDLKPASIRRGWLEVGLQQRGRLAQALLDVVERRLRLCRLDFEAVVGQFEQALVQQYPGRVAVRQQVAA